MLHLGVMNEALTPKQLAAIKMNARKTRIRNIRQRVAISVATTTAPSANSSAEPISDPQDISQ